MPHVSALSFTAIDATSQWVLAWRPLVPPNPPWETICEKSPESGVWMPWFDSGLYPFPAKSYILDKSFDHSKPWFFSFINWRVYISFHSVMRIKWDNANQSDLWARMPGTTPAFVVTFCIIKPSHAVYIFLSTSSINYKYNGSYSP